MVGRQAFPFWGPAYFRGELLVSGRVSPLPNGTYHTFQPSNRPKGCGQPGGSWRRDAVFQAAFSRFSESMYGVYRHVDIYYIFTYTHTYTCTCTYTYTCSYTFTYDTSMSNMYIYNIHLHIYIGLPLNIHIHPVRWFL